MLSRRALLRTGSVGVGSIFAGCSVLDRGVEGYVQLKSIGALEQTDGQQVTRSILRVTLSSPPGAGPPEFTDLHDEWANRFDTPQKPVVSDALHDELTRTYDTIRYVVGVCSPAWADDEESVGCWNVSTTRANFNRVQVHDQVRASSDGSYLSIHSVDGTWTFETE